MAITVPGLVRPQTVEDFSTVLTSIYNNDDDTSAAAAATPGTELIAFTGDIAESSGGKPGSLPLVADADCNSQASEFLDSIPSSTSIFRRRSSSGSRFARRQNKNENFCPQPIVPNPPKTQQQQSRPGRMPAAVLESPRLSDLLIQATRDQGPCRNFKRRYEVAVCAPPSVPPRPSFADLLIPCRLWLTKDPCSVTITEETWCCWRTQPLDDSQSTVRSLNYGYVGVKCERLEG